MDDGLSNRLVEQRWRNRVIESIEVLSRGNEGLKAVGYTEFFNGFFDQWRDGHLVVRPNSSVSAEEEQTVDALGHMLEEVSCETRHFTSEAEYIASACAERIEPLASAALRVFRLRGRSPEDREDETPLTRTIRAVPGIHVIPPQK